MNRIGSKLFARYRVLRLLRAAACPFSGAGIRLRLELSSTRRDRKVNKTQFDNQKPVVIAKVLHHKHHIMNIKRTFGAFFSIIGIIGLIYIAFQLIKRTTTPAIFAILAIAVVFSLVTGIICLIKNKKTRRSMRR